MAYKPSLSDIDEVHQSSDYSPTLEDIAQPQETEAPGFMGILSDVGSSIRNTPRALGHIFSSLPSEFGGALGQVRSEPGRALKNVGYGIEETARGAFNLPKQLSTYLAKKHIPGFETASKYVPNIPETGLKEYLGLDNQEAGDALLQSLLPAGKFAAIAEGGGLANALRRARNLGAYGATQGDDPITSGLTGLALEGGARGLSEINPKEAIKGLAPSRLLRGNLTKEQLRRNLEATRGTDTSLADVIDNPNMKRFMENVAAQTPWSGAANKLQETAKNVTDKGMDLFKKMTGDYDTEDAGAAIKQALTQASKDAYKKSGEKFKKVNDIAEQNNVRTPRGRMRATAQGLLDRIERDPDLESFRDGGEVKKLKSLASGERPYSRVNVITGKPITKTDFSLKDSDLLRADIGDLAHEAYTSGDKPKYNTYKSLKSALEDDINDAIDTSNVDELKKARDDAFAHYKENVAPFDDPDIVKFTRKGGDSDLILNHFLKNSRVNDRGNLLSKLTEKLESNKQGLVPAAYYSRALEGDSLNPLKFKTLHKSLGPKLKKVLLKDKELKKELDDYSLLVEKNTEGLNSMFNPKTGNRTQSYLAHALSGLGATTGYGLGGPLGLAAGIAAPGLSMRPLVRAMTSETVRDRLVNKMLNQEESPRKLQQALKRASAKIQPAAQLTNKDNE